MPVLDPIARGVGDFLYRTYERRSNQYITHLREARSKTGTDIESWLASYEARRGCIRRALHNRCGEPLEVRAYRQVLDEKMDQTE